MPANERRERATGAIAFVIDRSLLLIAGTIGALVWANTLPASYGAFRASALALIDDVGMVFFFGLATKEIAEATRPGGALASPREAAVPLLAAAGGMLVPAAIYAFGVWFAGDPSAARGWAIPCATDIAFSYLVARLIFPPKHPALPFLLLLAVADDALGLVILAVFYPTHAIAPLAFAGLMLPAVAFVWWLNRRSVQSFWPYVIVGGSLSWGALYFGGLHPALALVPIVPFMPCREVYHDLFEDHAVEASDTLNNFAAWWRVPVQVVLFFFGLANAGVPLSSVGLVTWLITASLLIGKPAGVLLSTLLAAAAGLRRPAGTTYGDIAIVGITAGIGFTVALFFATAAFPPGDNLDYAKMGALLSFVAAPLAIAGSRYRARRLRRA
jgi:NhaA family Na+:H+ antiporter